MIISADHGELVSMILRIRQLHIFKTPREAIDLFKRKILSNLRIELATEAMSNILNWPCIVYEMPYI